MSHTPCWIRGSDWERPHRHERSLRANHRHGMRWPSLRGRRMSAILKVDDLRVSFATEDGVVQAVSGVSFELQAGEVLAIVGDAVANNIAALAPTADGGAVPATRPLSAPGAVAVISLKSKPGPAEPGPPA